MDLPCSSRFSPLIGNLSVSGCSANYRRLSTFSPRRMQAEYLAGNAALSGSPPTSDERASYQIASHVLVDDNYHESTIALPTLGLFQTDWLQPAVCQNETVEQLCGRRVGRLLRQISNSRRGITVLCIGRFSHFDRLLSLVATCVIWIVQCLLFREAG